MAKYNRVTNEDKAKYIRLIEEDVKVMRVLAEIQSAYGVSERTAHTWLKKIRAEDVVGVGQTISHVTGTSTMYDRDGNEVLKWVKENVQQKNKDNGLLEAIVRYMDGELGSKPVVDKVYDVGDNSIMVKYPFADAHIGLLARSSEVGEDWDVEKARDMFVRGARLVIDSSPASEVGLILDLGDMLHVADSTGKTRGHGHVLDVDGTLADMYEAAIFVVTTMIDMALEKHDKVIFRKTIGNHDGDTSIALGVFLKRLYRDNERVQIECGENLFWSYRFGKTLHFSTHGHTVKQKELPEIMAHDCKAEWSDTDYRYADTGHVHHQQVIETRTCICECHNTLVPGDSYNYGAGYRSGRLLKSIVYDYEHGEIARNIVKLGMI